jgi:hypothetical protein
MVQGRTIYSEASSQREPDSERDLEKPDEKSGMRGASSMLTLLATTIAVVGALTPAQSQTSAEQKGSDPVSITECRTFKFMGIDSAKVGTIQFSFRNASPKTATMVQFNVTEAGMVRATFSYKGNYGPNAIITQRLNDKRLKPIDDPDALACSITHVDFSDGTSWEPTLGEHTIVEQTGAPVRLDTCNIENVAVAESRGVDNAPGFSIIATASFINTASQPVSAVRVHFDVYDAFDTLLGSVRGTSFGRFSPGALIQPAQNSSGYTYTPSSPAWQYYIGPGSSAFSHGISPNDVRQTKCWIETVRFEDGSIWRSALKEGATLDPTPPRVLPSNPPIAETSDRDTRSISSK